MTKRSIRLVATVLGLLLGACGAAPSSAPEAPQAAGAAAAAEQKRFAKELHRIGLAHYRSGDSLRAEEYLASSLELGASANAVLRDLMQASVSGRRYQAALRYFEDYRADLSHARRAELELVAGVLYLGVEQPEMARDSFEKTLQLQPANARAQLLLAQVFHDELQDYARADAHFRAYLALEPNGDGAELARSGLLKEPVSAPSPATAGSRRTLPQRVVR